MERMLEKGISTRRGIMTSHRESAYKNELKNVSLPESEKYADNSVILPLYYPMSTSDIETVIKEVQLLLSGA